MAITKPRNRIVIFRLTEDEYERLEAACSEGGARSLSDFARSKVLGNSVGPQTSLVEIERRLNDLAGAVEDLARILMRS